MLTWICLVVVGLLAVALTFYAAGHWQGERYLCDTCRYNDPDRCLKPERPQAIICAAYRSAR